MEKPRLRLPISRRELARRLLEWFGRHQRVLPWRTTPTPYRVWLSEVMLQQTQVKTVVPYFERFLTHYPCVEDLAQAPEEEVLDLWAGLGYYRRARNLHQAARRIREEHGGRFPSDFDTALALPGMGRYSTGAVLSIAYGLPFPVLDGNVKRVLARLLCLEAPIEAQLTTALWELLERTVEEPKVRERIGDFNQALMELGALVCLPAAPRCEECPLQAACRARKRGLERELPRKGKRGPTLQLTYTYAVVEEEAGFLMARNEGGGLLEGFWEFPRVEGLVSGDDARQVFRDQHGLEIRPGELFGPVRHQVTHRKLRFYPLRAELTVFPAPGPWHWVDPTARGYPVPAYIRKVLARLRNGSQPEM